MFNLSMSELVIILAVALLVFGPSKLPEIGRAFGKSVRDFKDETEKAQHDAVRPTLPDSSSREQGR